MRWEPEGDEWKGENPEEYDRLVKEAEQISEKYADHPEQAMSILMQWADDRPEI